MLENKNTTRRFETVSSSRTFKNICDLFDLRCKSVLDIGCGYGQYLKHFGAGSIGLTTANEEVEYGNQNNLKIVFGNAEHLNKSIGSGFKAIWANNIFEHLLSPHAFLMNLKKFSSDDALIIIGVPVVPKIVSLIRTKRWRGVLASNHINFFTHITVGLTVKMAGWSVVYTRPFIFKNCFLDLLVRPFAPHMYVVAKNNPDFKYPPKKIHEWIEDEHYDELLKITKQI
jgi:SAM-dependent methyltransferase